MKKLSIIYLAAGTLLVGFFGCKKSFLEQEADGRLPVENIWGTADRAFGFLSNTYSNLPGGYMRIDGAMLASASDEAKHSADVSNIQDMVNGSWNPVNPVENVWNTNYAGIRKVNLFFENIDKVPLQKRDNAQGIDLDRLKVRERMKGEAFFLRAFFYFELVKRYGGVPLILKSLSREDDLANIGRASVDDCMKQIFLDCDSAEKRLLLEFKGSIPEYDGVGQTGRATKGAAIALKARAMLYYASPLFNPNANSDRWIDAAKAAKWVMDLSAGNRYGLLTLSSTAAYNNIFYQSGGAGQYHNEIIFSSNYFNDNAFDRSNAPLAVNGQGLTNPTQEMVDAFGMSNGLSISDSRSGYNPANPYENRDPRFYASIKYHGATISQNDMVQSLNVAQGIDRVDAFKATRTGYYLAKFSSASSVWDLRSVTVNRTNVLIRFAEVLLNYAEAQNEAVGPDASVYAAVERIRLRAGLNPYKLPTGLDKTQMRQMIRDERRVELCFEEHRFFDIRRWNLYGKATMNIPVTGVNVSINEMYDTKYTNFVVENRQWSPKMYLMPIPQTEIAKSNALKQNPGW